MHRRAFTVVELLVVISIIMLLLALLMPALRQARGEVRIAMCLSNLRQIHVAVQGYADDNLMNEPWLFANGSGDHPHESGDNVNLGRPGTPAVALTQWSEMLPDGRVFFCPDVPVDYTEFYHPRPDHSGLPRFEKFHGTYSWHWRKILRTHGEAQAGNGLHWVNDESEGLVMVDAADSAWFSWGFPYQSPHVNALFVDGEVRQVARGAEFDIEHWLWGPERRPYP